MSIKKQDFYEGAALSLLARTRRIQSLRYEPPFFLLNEQVLVYLKYCTRARSPWGFTFTPDEQRLLQRNGRPFRLVIGLICGADGVAALTYDCFLKAVAPSNAAVHIACRRCHNEHYAVNGPEASLDRKIASSMWLRILDQGGNDESP
jgi:hypothetical protein